MRGEDTPSDRMEIRSAHRYLEEADDGLSQQAMTQDTDRDGSTRV